MRKNPPVYTLILVLGMALLVAACGEAEVPQDDETGGTSAVQPTTASDGTAGYPAAGSQSGYPGPGTAVPGYPGPAEVLEGLSDEPPNPERSLPDPSAEGAVIGGVLVREVTGSGFVPLDPHDFILGEIVYGDSGNLALLRYNEQSIRAETFPTGVFVFTDVPPGDYGFVVDLGVTEIPIIQEDGSELTISVEAGEVYDLGQLFVVIP